MSTANGKVAIITGASAGIGKASAVALLKAGYSVAFAGRRQAELEAAVASAGEDASRGLAVVTDVGNPASVKALFDKTVVAFGTGGRSFALHLLPGLVAMLAAFAAVLLWR